MVSGTTPINAMMLLILAAMPANAAAPPATRPSAASVSAPAGASGLLTQEAIRDLYASGDYPKTLQALVRALALKGKAAEWYDRHEFLQIKGETHIRLKATAAAAAAFEEASRLASDEASRAQDVAIQLLMKRVNQTMVYQPRLNNPTDPTKRQAPVSVVEPEDRAKAVKLLYQDEMAAITPRVMAIERTPEFPAIFAIVPAIRDVRCLELTATGSSGQTQALAQRIFKVAQPQLEGALERMESSTDDINHSSMNIIPLRRQDKYYYLWQGPNDRQFATLKETISTCVKLYDMCGVLGQTIGSTGTELDAVDVQVKRVARKAKWLCEVLWKQDFCHIDQAVDASPWKHGPYSYDNKPPYGGGTPPSLGDIPATQPADRQKGTELTPRKPVDNPTSGTDQGQLR